MDEKTITRYTSIDISSLVLTEYSVFLLKEYKFNNTVYFNNLQVEIYYMSKIQIFLGIHVNLNLLIH